MPIWSLTKERVEKLLKQISDKEIEMDTLIKLSKEDLWNRDLEEFIAEWRFQLADQDKREKHIRSLGRRESRKLKIGAAKGGAGRKRKQSDDSDDSDFAGPAKKTVASKPAVVKSSQPRQGLLSHLSPLAEANQPKPKLPKAPKATIEPKKEVPSTAEITQPIKNTSEDIWMNVDGVSDIGLDAPVAPIFHKAKVAAAATKKAAPRKTVKSEAESDEEIVKPTVASRKPRAAATKPVKYNTLSDSDDSNGDDLLFDVGKMVKGIGNASTDQPSNSRPLFSTSMSRPGSSAGLPKKQSSTKHTLDLDGDDTDYSKLVPANKVTANATILSDDDNDVDMDDDDFQAPAAPPPKKAPPKAKEALKPKPKPIPKAAPRPAPAPPKKLALSPAAKAYAAKQERNRKKPAISDDDDENVDDEIDKVADELLDDDDDDDEEEEVVTARPSRRAAAEAGKKKAWVLEDEGSEGDGDGVEGDTGNFVEESEDDY